MINNPFLTKKVPIVNTSQVKQQVINSSSTSKFTHQNKNSNLSQPFESEQPKSSAKQIYENQNEMPYILKSVNKGDRNVAVGVSTTS